MPRFFQVGGAGAQDQANGASPHCDRAAVRQFPYAHGKVNVLFYQVHVSIGEPQPRLDIRKGAQKFHDDRQKMAAAQYRRRGDDQGRP